MNESYKVKIFDLTVENKKLRDELDEYKLKSEKFNSEIQYYKSIRDEKFKRLGDIENLAKEIQIKCRGGFNQLDLVGRLDMPRDAFPQFRSAAAMALSGMENQVSSQMLGVINMLNKAYFEDKKDK